MSDTCHGTYIDPDGLPTLRDEDAISLDVDGFEFDQVFLHLSAKDRNVGTATVVLSSAYARKLARELKKAAKQARR
jgi:hypothetical protein